MLTYSMISTETAVSDLNFHAYAAVNNTSGFEVVAPMLPGVYAFWDVTCVCEGLPDFKGICNLRP